MNHIHILQRTRRKRYVISGTVALLVVALPAIGRTRTIEGCIKDEAGIPVSADIQITRQDDDGRYHTRTDDSRRAAAKDRRGCYIHAGLPGGTYVVSVVPRGALPSPPKRTIELSDDIRLDFVVISRRVKGASVKSGTGFWISTQGHIVTNYHVVEGCSTISTALGGQSQTLLLIAEDRVNDLAILKAPQGAHFEAMFAGKGQLKLGLPVVAVGYPLRDILASSINLTTGVLSSTAGPGNDARLAQFTAPVQPGNSGGPLLDMQGHVIGIVVSKLDGIRTALLTGNIPEGVNFAIKNEIVELFLDLNNIEYKIAAAKMSGETKKDIDTVAVGELAAKFTIPLQCDVSVR